MEALQQAQETFPYVGNVLYLDFGDGYLDIFIDQNAVNQFLTRYSLLFIVITHKLKHIYERRYH